MGLTIPVTATCRLPTILVATCTQRSPIHKIRMQSERNSSVIFPPPKHDVYPYQATLSLPTRVEVELVCGWGWAVTIKARRVNPWTILGTTSTRYKLSSQFKDYKEIYEWWWHVFDPYKIFLKYLPAVCSLNTSSRQDLDVYDW